MARMQRRRRICALFSKYTESSKLRVTGSSPVALTIFQRYCVDDSDAAVGAASARASAGLSETQLQCQSHGSLCCPIALLEGAAISQTVTPSICDVCL